MMFTTPDTTSRMLAKTALPAPLTPVSPALAPVLLALTALAELLIGAPFGSVSGVVKGSPSRLGGPSVSDPRSGRKGAHMRVGVVRASLMLGRPRSLSWGEAGPGRPPQNAALKHWPANERHA